MVRGRAETIRRAEVVRAGWVRRPYRIQPLSLCRTQLRRAKRQETPVEQGGSGTAAAESRWRERQQGGGATTRGDPVVARARGLATARRHSGGGGRCRRRKRDGSLRASLRAAAASSAGGLAAGAPAAHAAPAPASQRCPRPSLLRSRAGCRRSALVFAVGAWIPRCMGHNGWEARDWDCAGVAPGTAREDVELKEELAREMDDDLGLATDA